MYKVELVRYEDKVGVGVQEHEGIWLGAWFWVRTGDPKYFPAFDRDGIREAIKKAEAWVRERVAGEENAEAVVKEYKKTGRIQ
jgi:hypothetical protein